MRAVGCQRQNHRLVSNSIDRYRYPFSAVSRGHGNFPRATCERPPPPPGQPTASVPAVHTIYVSILPTRANTLGRGAVHTVCCTDPADYCTRSTGLSLPLLTFATPRRGAPLSEELRGGGAHDPRRRQRYVLRLDRRGPGGAFLRLNLPSPIGEGSDAPPLSPHKNHILRRMWVIIK